MDNPTLQSLIQKGKHQPGMFKNVHPEDMSKFLNSWMPRGGRNKRQDAEALEIYAATHDALRKNSAHRPLDLAEGTPTPTPPEDPCEGDRNCYVNALAAYGVIIPEEEFTAGNAIKLRSILDSIEIIGNSMSAYIGNDISPEDAFKLIFGPVEFQYDADSTGNLASTAVPDDSPTGERGIAVITLVEASFKVRSPLDPKFVVMHELGHVFHNRHGNATGDDQEPGTDTDKIVYDYVQATNAIWTFAQPILNVGPTQLGGVRRKNDKGQFVDTDGNVIPTDAKGNPLNRDDKKRFVYDIPQGSFIAGEFNDDLPGFLKYFPNERNHPSAHPKEGFADTFANLMLYGLIFLEGDARGDYFDHFGDWVADIAGSNSGQ